MVPEDLDLITPLFLGHASKIVRGLTLHALEGGNPVNQKQGSEDSLVGQVSSFADCLRTSLQTLVEFPAKCQALQSAWHDHWIEMLVEALAEFQVG